MIKYFLGLVFLFSCLNCGSQNSSDLEKNSGQKNEATSASNTPWLSSTKESHGHAPLHGGIIRSTEKHLHIEAYFARDGRIEVYPLDDVVNPMSAKGFSGTVYIEEGANTKTYPLEYRSTQEFDLLAAKAPEFSEDFVNAIVDIKGHDGHRQARFRYDLRNNAEGTRHDHSSRHGGQVGMAGEYHLEMLLEASGVYKLYLTDARRAPLSSSVAKNAKLIIEPDSETPEVLTLKQDEKASAFLYANGEKREKGPFQVKVEMDFAEKPLSMDFLLSLPDENIDNLSAPSKTSANQNISISKDAAKN